MAEDIKEIREQNIWHILFTLLFLTLLIFAIVLLNSLNKLYKPVPVFDFILMAIAVFRLIHLFVYDYITHFVRDYFGKFKTGPFKTIANLLSCEWCTGIWLALFIGFAYFLTPFTWYAILIIALGGIGTFIDLIAQRLIR